MKLRDTFRAPFLELAWQRHRRIVDSLGSAAGELKASAAELHCLSGEASMLDYKDVAELARVGEQAARAGERDRVVALVEEIRAALKGVEQEAI